jgi:serine protease Do
MKPDSVVVNFVGREIQKRNPGESIAFTVLRGSARVETKVVLGEEPKLENEADRKFFDRIGFTAREFVFDDAVARRVKPTENGGVIAHFIKANGPAATAGLRIDDWIKEIDGVEVKSYAAAMVQLSAIESDKFRTECVLLVSRGGETSILRVKL